jgi:hypothetical protein
MHARREWVRLPACLPACLPAAGIYSAVASPARLAAGRKEGRYVTPAKAQRSTATIYSSPSRPVPSRSVSTGALCRRCPCRGPCTAAHVSHQTRGPFGKFIRGGPYRVQRPIDPEKDPARDKSASRLTHLLPLPTFFHANIFSFLRHHS